MWKKEYPASPNSTEYNEPYLSASVKTFLHKYFAQSMESLFMSWFIRWLLNIFIPLGHLGSCLFMLLHTLYQNAFHSFAFISSPWTTCGIADAWAHPPELGFRSSGVGLGDLHSWPVPTGCGHWRSMGTLPWLMHVTFWCHKNCESSSLLVIAGQPPVTIDKTCLSMRRRINLFQSLSTQRSLHKEFSQTSPELYISLHSVI